MFNIKPEEEKKHKSKFTVKNHLEKVGSVLAHRPVERERFIRRRRVEEPAVLPAGFDDDGSVKCCPVVGKQRKKIKVCYW